ncbi:MAG: GNAT family N-acetyltransferase [Chloroflexi bacterium]|nr:GNAT family N-acetyltransferase [Chloroflexota bacterium]MCA2002506.1 GNAT family N-acetyltransferase [Chloroflexota bacterium]
MQILPANLLDLNALRKLEDESFGKDAWSLLDLIAVLTMPDVIRLKAVEDGQMVGFVAGDPRPRDGWGWIATIAVAPRYRRRGIGRALLHACEAKLNVPRSRLTVRVSNQSAISMYQQEGYVTTDIWSGYYNDGEDGIVMEKALSNSPEGL